MRTLLGFSTLALLVFAVSPAAADAELLLTDGTVLKGVDVRLEGGYYLLELEGGEVAAIPARAVRELHLLDLRPTSEGTTIGVATDVSKPLAQQAPVSRFIETRPGWRRGAPRDLAGSSWRLHDSKQQTAVFGEPAKFQAGLPFRFTPVPAWDRSKNVLEGSRSSWQRPVLDPVWRPVDAFDHRADVLGASRSSWPTSPRATTWNPSNSFSRLRADLWWGRDPPDRFVGERRVAPRARLDWRGVFDECGWCGQVAPQPRPFTEIEKGTLTAERCARRLFAGAEHVETLQWVEIDTGPWVEMPLEIHRAWIVGGPRAVFTIAGGACRLIAGDLRELIGVDLTETDALSFAVTAWNQLQAELPPTALPVTPTRQLDHAVALAGLVETATAGRSRARMELLQDRADIERWLGRGTACTKSSAYRRGQRANVDRNFAAPRTEVEPDWTDLAFWTWLSRDGEVFAYAVRLFTDGRVAISRETIAEHLGEHEDSR